jgi:hypothetical protein
MAVFMEHCFSNRFCASIVVITPIQTHCGRDRTLGLFVYKKDLMFFLWQPLAAPELEFMLETI